MEQPSAVNGPRLHETAYQAQLFTSVCANEIGSLVEFRAMQGLQLLPARPFNNYNAIPTFIFFSFEQGDVYRHDVRPAPSIDDLQPELS